MKLKKRKVRVCSVLGTYASQLFKNSFVLKNSRYRMATATKMSFKIYLALLHTVT